MVDHKSVGWKVVVNLHAGSKKCEKDWPKIESLLNEAGFLMDIEFTQRQGHTIEIVQTAIETQNVKHFIIVGGDGTLNEAVNGIFKQNKYKSTDILLGMITVGTGNDWGRMYGMPESYKQQVRILQEAHEFVQDVGVVQYRYDSANNKRYFINIAGMGYDALVAKKTNTMKQKGRGGVLVYLINLVAGLFQYKNTYLDIDADGTAVFSGRVFSMSIGICKYNGGGMMQLPFAIPDDGEFDVTVIRKTTKMTVIKNIKNLYDGSFIKMKEVELFKGKKFSISSTPAHSLYLETDGESLGHSPLDFEVLPKSLRFIVGEKGLAKLRKESLRKEEDF